jgi:hypothetical protein
MTIVTIFGKQENDGKILYLGKWDGWQNKFSWLEATHAQITKDKIADYESKGIALTYDDKSVKPKKAFQHELQKPFDYEKEMKKNLNLATMELIVDGTKYVFYKMPNITFKGRDYEFEYDYYICRMGVVFNNSKTNNQYGIA